MPERTLKTTASNLIATCERLSKTTSDLAQRIEQSRKQLNEIRSLLKSTQPNGPSTQNAEIIERLEKIYVHLEHIIMYEAARFSNSGKANLRRAQSELQKIRLSLLGHK